MENGKVENRMLSNGETRGVRDSEERAAKVMAILPDHLAVRFRARLERKKDAVTERGRKTRLAEIESEL